MTYAAPAFVLRFVLTPHLPITSYAEASALALQRSADLPPGPYTLRAYEPHAPQYQRRQQASLGGAAGGQPLLYALRASASEWRGAYPELSQSHHLALPRPWRVVVMRLSGFCAVRVVGLRLGYGYGFTVAV